MRCSTFFSTAVLALTANAFLIPNGGDFVKTGLGPQDLVAIAEIKASGAVSIDLDCAECTKLVKSDGRMHSEGKGTTYEMQFENQKKQLLLNGVPIYPPSLSALTTTMQVQQKGADVGPIPVSYAVDMIGTEQIGDLTSILLNVQLLQIGDSLVDIPSITVGLIREAEGELFIHTVKITKSTLDAEARKCNNILCRARALLKAKLSSLRAMMRTRLPSFRGGCSRKMGQADKDTVHHQGPKKHGGPRVHGGIPKFMGKFPPKNGPHSADGKHHHHHGSHHHHHSRFGRMMHRFARVIHQIILPVLVGISAGMTLGAVSMAIFHGIHAIRMRCTRRNYQRVEIVDSDVLEDGKADGLPQYEELESQVECDEKKELLG